MISGKLTICTREEFEQQYRRREIWESYWVVVVEPDGTMTTEKDRFNYGPNEIEVKIGVPLQRFKSE